MPLLFSPGSSLPLVQSLEQILSSDNATLTTAYNHRLLRYPFASDRWKLNQKNHSQYHTITALPQYSSAQLAHAVSPFTGPSVGKARPSSNIT
jgi:hypothetical protein